ncbi:MAG: S24/S26 family peptidase [Polyangiales bacterium]
MSLAVRAIVAALRDGQTVRWVVRGGSMWPAIPDGSEVEVTPCAASDLRVGEVAAFCRGGALVVHRVIARSGDGLRFRGDSLRRDDGLVPPGEVLGRAKVLRRARLRWTRPRRDKLLGAARAALEWLRAHAQP